jgi:hypothetical protein
MLLDQSVRGLWKGADTCNKYLQLACVCLCAARPAEYGGKDDEIPGPLWGISGEEPAAASV